MIQSFFNSLFCCQTQDSVVNNNDNTLIPIELSPKQIYQKLLTQTMDKYDSMDDSLCSNPTNENNYLLFHLPLHIGNVIVKYISDNDEKDPNNGLFYYYCDNHVPAHFLNILACKYAIRFHCKQVFVPSPKCSDDTLDKKNDDTLDKKNDDTLDKPDSVKSLKTSKSSKSKKYNIVKKINRFKRIGKFHEFNILSPKTCVSIKSKISFNEFKALQLATYKSNPLQIENKEDDSSSIITESIKTNKGNSFVCETIVDIVEEKTDVNDKTPEIIKTEDCLYLPPTEPVKEVEIINEDCMYLPIEVDGEEEKEEEKEDH